MVSCHAFLSLGGIRSYSVMNRTSLISSISILLSNSTFNPFHLENSKSITVLSGEQEGLYSWLAVNYHFISQKLLNPPNGELKTFGNVELNFISSHLAFQLHVSDTIQHTFEISLPSVTVPLYSMSYPSYGYNTLQDQYIEYLVNIGFQQYLPHSAVIPSVLDYCFYSGYRESFLSTMPTVRVEVYGPSVPAQDAMERCLSSLSFFLSTSPSTTRIFSQKEEETGLWQTVYQPSLRYYHDLHSNVSYQFVGTGLISYAAALLHLPVHWTLPQWRSSTKKLCSMSFHDVMIYGTSADISPEDREIYSVLLPSSCLLSSYILILLKGIFLL